MSIYVDIKKRLGSFNLDVKFESEKETLALLGASGCGKSMTLKCIAGIEKPDSGKIVLDGVTLFDSEKRINLSPQKRKTGLLFQNYALFPNMTVKQNIACGIKYEKNSPEKTEKINRYMEKFGLLELSEHLPSQLSGGQQQRCALARVLISEPNMLLLDEPFSALDSHLRFRLEQEVKNVIKDFGKSVILVSHDKDEVFRLSDRIAVMEAGKVDSFGPKEEIFERPATKVSAVLTGCKNISEIDVTDSTHIYAKDWGLTFEASEDPESFVFAGLKSDLISETPGSGTEFDITGVLENPQSYTLMLRASSSPNGKELLFEKPKEDYDETASQIWLTIPEAAVMLLK